MPTYYNGKEITSTSVMSGLSLVGKSSIIVGGRTVTLSTDPPPPLLEMLELYFTGDKTLDPFTACSINTGGDQIFLFSDFGYANTGSFLFEDDAGTIPFDGGNFFYFDPQQNGVVTVDSNGMIGPLTGCR